MVSREIPSATAAHAIPKDVRWQPCVAASHTFNVMAPPAQPLLRRCNTRTNGLQSGETRSRRPSEPWSVPWARPLASRRRTSARAPSDLWGGIALLMARVNPDTIRIIGRWRSDTMLHYLHTTSNSVTYGLAVRMFQYSDYALILIAHAVG